MEKLGHYRIVERLGQGAMGSVYRAVDEKLDRPVALKVLRLHLDEEEYAGYSARLFQEARSAARINHPNIITVFDCGTLDGQTYLAMELVEGRTLRTLLDKQSPMPVANVIVLALQLFDALAFAHAREVVHRDIKPGNLMFDDNSRLKITDFGIAQLPASELTRTGTFVGSPRYMAPEQIECKRVDGRADIFSAGIVLYEALTGRVPFDGDHMASIAYRILYEVPADPKDITPDVPGWLSSLVMRCMEKNPAERYQSADQVLSDMRAILAAGTAPALVNAAVLAVPAVPAGKSKSSSQSKAAAKAASKTKREAKAKAAPNSYLLMGVAFAAVLGIGAGIFAWQRISHSGDSTALAKPKVETKAAEILPPPGAKGSVPASVAEAPPPAPTPDATITPAALELKPGMVPVKADVKSDTPPAALKPNTVAIPPVAPKQASGSTTSTGKTGDQISTAAARKTAGRQVTIEQLLNERAAAAAPAPANTPAEIKSDGDCSARNDCPPVKRREHRDR